MQVTRSRTARINMGNYEHVETGASLTMEFPDETPIEEVTSRLNKGLNALLLHDLQTMRKLSVNDTSFVKEMEL